jgi:sn-glycerol 3-phosphate transport system permease protein
VDRGHLRVHGRRATDHHGHARRPHRPPPAAADRRRRLRRGIGAGRLLDQRGAALVGAAREAFTQGLHATAAISAVVALAIAVGKIVISMLSAFAIVYFDFRGRQFVFWMIFVTLMLPVPVRIMSTYEVISTLGWIDSYWGLTVPLIASATATFLFRQFYQTVPASLAEAAQLDGAGPLRFLWSFLLPLSWTNVAALFVILFIYGWNEYLWPLMVTNSEEMRTVVIGIEKLVPRGGGEIPEWNVIMAAAMLALVPPVAVILFMQRWFVKGLIETEK